MSTPHVKHAPAAEPAPQQPTAESLGWQLRAALPPLRLQSVSIYDQAGEVLWLSEGALGPDENGFVVEALGALTGDSSSSQRERDFEDGRGAVFLAVRSPQAELVGLVMILVDAKALSTGGLAARILTPPVRALLQRLAILLRPASAAPGAIPSTAGGPMPAPAAVVPPAAPQPSARARSPAGAPPAHVGSTTSRTLEILEWSPPEPLTGPDELSAPGGQSVPDGQSEAGVPTTDEMLAPSAVEEILTFELAESAAGAPPAHAAPAHAARAQASPGADRAVSPRSTPGELHVQELAKLRPGGRTRRLRLLPELPGQSGHPASPSRSVGLAHAGRTSRELVEHALTAPLRELAAWLAAHEALEDSASLYFSLAVPATVLEIDDLPEILAECVRATRLATGSIGFEIPESACVREPERVERLIHTLEQLGCFLVLDDFTFDTGALELLRSKALRLVKVDRTLIRAALRDKLAQARIVAISQAARVLGIHCAAKHVDALAIQRWLAAAGFDFAEGAMFPGPAPLGSLAGKLAER